MNEITIRLREGSEQEVVERVLAFAGESYLTEAANRWLFNLANDPQLLTGNLSKRIRQAGAELIAKQAFEQMKDSPMLPHIVAAVKDSLQGNLDPQEVSDKVMILIERSLLAQLGGEDFVQNVIGQPAIQKAIENACTAAAERLEANLQKLIFMQDHPLYDHVLSEVRKKLSEVVAKVCDAEDSKLVEDLKARIQTQLEIL